MKKDKFFLYFILVCCLIAGCKKTENDDISFVQTGTALVR